jgi:hypothetical protein
VEADRDRLDQCAQVGRELAELVNQVLGHDRGLGEPAAAATVRS